MEMVNGMPRFAIGLPQSIMLGVMVLDVAVSVMKTRRDARGIWDIRDIIATVCKVGLEFVLLLVGGFF